MTFVLPKHGSITDLDGAMWFPSLRIAPPIHPIFSFASLVEVIRGDVWFSLGADFDRVIFPFLSSSKRFSLPSPPGSTSTGLQRCVWHFSCSVSPFVVD
jgi:hypothetical protein